MGGSLIGLIILKDLNKPLILYVPIWGKWVTFFCKSKKEYYFCMLVNGELTFKVNTTYPRNASLQFYWEGKGYKPRHL